MNKSGEALVQEAIGEPTGQTSQGYNYWGNDPEMFLKDETSVASTKAVVPTPETFKTTDNPEYTNSVKKIQELNLSYNTNEFNKTKVLVHRLGVNSSRPAKDIFDFLLSILNSNQSLYLSTSAVPNPDILKDGYYSEYIPGEDSPYIEKLEISIFTLLMVKN